MVKIPPFEVEQWMDTYETTPGVLNIAETCASSISLSELTSFHENNNNNNDKNGPPPPPVLDLDLPMTYGAIRGSETLRRNIAATYSQETAEAEAEAVTVKPENILVTQGAIAANHLIFYTFINPGDHVICVFPTYQQLYEIPRTLGAEVSLWELRAEDGFVPDVAALEGLIRSNTKMLIINNPNNPTGTSTPLTLLKSLTTIAKTHSLLLLSDEVYRPLFHSPPQSHPPPPSALSLAYPKTLTTSSLSKAYSLAGIRVGWIASLSPDLITALSSARDYTTISVSRLDDSVAAYALSSTVRPALLRRNISLARANLSLLAAFIDAHQDVCDWVRPEAGTTAFVRFSENKGEGERGKPVDDEAFCKDVLEKTKVLVVPGAKCFGDGRTFHGYVRIGYVCETGVLREALERLGEYVEENLR